MAKYLLDECACFKYSEKEVSKQPVGTGLFDFCFLRFQLSVITKKCHSVVKAIKGLIKSQLYISGMQLKHFGFASVEKMYYILFKFIVHYQKEKKKRKRNRRTN